MLGACRPAGGIFCGGNAESYMRLKTSMAKNRRVGRPSPDSVRNRKERGKVSLFARVRKVGVKIPGLEQSTAWNGPCLKANKKIAACMATHKSAEPGTLVVVVGEDVRDELIEADPAVYYLKDHYAPWPTVLVRLELIDDVTLRDLLTMAVRYRSAETTRSVRMRRR